jgi:hypothetical protein
MSLSRVLPCSPHYITSVSILHVLSLTQRAMDFFRLQTVPDSDVDEVYSARMHAPSVRLSTIHHLISPTLFASQHLSQPAATTTSLMTDQAILDSDVNQAIENIGTVSRP